MIRTFKLLATLAALTTPALAQLIGIQPPTPNALPSLRITEIMYNPAGGSAFEYIEIQNIGDTAVSLEGVKIAGARFAFGAGAEIGANAVIVVGSAEDPTAFATRYPGVEVIATFEGRLSNGGERLALETVNGTTIESVEYDDQNEWPAEADGAGPSLERLDIFGSPNDPTNWVARDRSPQGTPGAIIPDPPSSLNIAINEFFANRPTPADSTETFPDWVELKNVGSTVVDLSFWSLSDSRENPTAIQIPEGVVLGPSEFIVLDLDRVLNDDGTTTGFRLDREGESLFLFDASGTERDSLSFGNQIPDHSLGLIGQEWVLNQPTPGEENTAAVVGEVSQIRINEWLADSPPGEPDWFELYNLDSNLPVPLSGIIFSTDTQRFQLQLPSYIAANGFVRFLADERPGPSHVDFKLPASSGSLTLTSAAGVEIDTIVYAAQSDGLTEGRLPDGSDNIQALTAGPSPEQPNDADADQDGINDSLEIAIGLNPNDPSDALGDLDNDGFSNLDESKAGTNPTDPNSNLRLAIIQEGQDQFRISFESQRGKSYGIERKSTAPDSAWVPIFHAVQGLVAEETAFRVNVRGLAPSMVYRAVSPRPEGFELDPILRLRATDETGGSFGPSRFIIDLREPAISSSIGPDSIEVLQAGEPVAFTTRFVNDFTTISLNPTELLLSNIPFEISIKSDLIFESGATLDSDQTFTVTTAPSHPIVDRASVYEEDHPGVEPIYLTISDEINVNPTFEDVLNDTDSRDDFKPRVRVTFGSTAEEANQPPNATLRQRGDSVRLHSQKSFRIDLDADSPVWRGHRIVNLNKHPWDLTRVRNKLCFDLFETIPNLTSLRTQFVHLFINGEDQGLYTQIEHYGEDFLKNHGLDPDGNLYKADDFDFIAEDALVERTDPNYDEAAFEAFLEIKGSNDHSQLVKMMADVNDWDLNFNETIDKHFNRDNVITWFAFNLLSRNTDTINRNFYLYRQSTSATWYFLPWDYDSTLGFRQQPDNVFWNPQERWRDGLSNWWQSHFVRRLFEDPNVLDEVIAKMELILAEYTDADTVANLLDTYRPIVTEQVSRQPDTTNLPVIDWPNRVDEFSQTFDTLYQTFQEGYNVFIEAVERPIAVWLGNPQLGASGWEFYWAESIDLQGDEIYYDLEVNRSPEFTQEESVFTVNEITEPFLITDIQLEPGAYFWRIITRDRKDPENNWQIPYDVYWDPEAGRVFHGMWRFVVE